MDRRILACLIATSALIPAPALAQDSEVEALRAQLSAMQAEMARLNARLDAIEQAEAQPVAIAAPAPPPAPAPASAPAIAMRGAPEITAPGGWSFKPRGRIQFDAGSVSAPAGITDNSTGFGSEVRRAYLGFEGKIPGGFGYRAEIDIAGSSVEVTDLYLTYQTSDQLTLMVGQTKPFWGLDEITSDLFTSMTERAAFNGAFGHERRLGVNAAWSSGPLIVQAGVFTDNVADLNNDENNALSLDARAVFAPKIGDTQLHLAGSVHLRDFNDSASTTRYRARPFIHTPDIRFVDTGSINASGEDGYGLEAAVISGPFHAAAEWRWQQVNATALPSDPTFAGGYLEAGMFLTHGDTRGYRGGAFDRTRPANALGSGGIGAVQVNLRYDYLDLTDGTILGGSQNGYLASLVWLPTGFTKLTLNYGHLAYSGAALPAAGADRDYSVDTIGMRAQIDF